MWSVVQACRAHLVLRLAARGALQQWDEHGEGQAAVYTGLLDDPCSQVSNFFWQRKAAVSTFGFVSCRNWPVSHWSRADSETADSWFSSGFRFSNWRLLWDDQGPRKCAAWAMWGWLQDEFVTQGEVNAPLTPEKNSWFPHLHCRSFSS